MPVSLEFETTHRYTDENDGINVPITLGTGNESVELLVKLDTGAEHCIFERKYGETLSPVGFNVFGPLRGRLPVRA